MNAALIVLAALLLAAVVAHVARLVLDDLAAAREAAPDAEHEAAWDALVSETPIHDGLALEVLRDDLERWDAAARRLAGGGA